MNDFSNNAVVALNSDLEDEPPGKPAGPRSLDTVISRALKSLLNEQFDEGYWC